MPITWRLQRATSGGGSGADIGSHVIDMAPLSRGRDRGRLRPLSHPFRATPGGGKAGRNGSGRRRRDHRHAGRVRERHHGRRCRPAGLPAATRWTSPSPSTGPKGRSSTARNGRPRFCSIGQPTQRRRAGSRPSRSALPIRAANSSGRWPAWRSASARRSSLPFVTFCAASPPAPLASPSFLDGLRASEVVAAAQRSARAGPGSRCSRAVLDEPVPRR